ncbi:MAG: maleylpyruvate isomerase family mycothiol-dependent enzyme [Actinomycetota bacterium]|nr:maleylpyruvate isomerase family mycothiol-dependent enzyme [Actinomycetota bacterium]
MSNDTPAAADLDDVRSRIQILTTADAALRAALATLDPDIVAGPSLLPDWTVGHVVSHLSRNADGLSNLLLWAKTGVETPMYASPEARDSGVEAGAHRSAANILADYVSSSDAFATAVAAMPDSAWPALVRTRTGGPIPADVVLDHRISEVYLHHHDLGVDGGLAELSDDEGSALLSVLLRTYVRTHDVPPLVLAPAGGDRLVLGSADSTTDAPEVSGSAIALAGWMTGRSDGSDLTSAGLLPALPNW